MVDVYRLRIDCIILPLIDSAGLVGSTLSASVDCAGAGASVVVCSVGGEIAAIRPFELANLLVNNAAEEITSLSNPLRPAAAAGASNTERERICRGEMKVKKNKKARPENTQIWGDKQPSSRFAQSKHN